MHPRSPQQKGVTGRTVKCLEHIDFYKEVESLRRRDTHDLEAGHLEDDTAESGVRGSGRGSLKEREGNRRVRRSQGLEVDLAIDPEVKLGEGVNRVGEI